MSTLIFSVLFLAAFLLGSIPFGIIIAKIKGVDLKKVGSGNIGATNVLRSLGKWPAAITLCGDILKGTLAVALARYFEAGPVWEGFIGISAILGHNFSVFLGFRGGKGVATSLGVLMIYSPLAAFLTLIIWLAVVVLTKYSSLGALISFALLPLNVFLFDTGYKGKLLITLLIAVIIFLRHRENLKRLLQGTERKIGQRI
ncbi:MAG: glycerol-3-phosphate 1-O-acyltransferase PlsY [Thermodesulfovibrionales bacterium]|nr:glycerol-3-phosphate 1-O-acyltransferase PlsY [Thermodesulfovibrionales bacterium]